MNEVVDVVLSQHKREPKKKRIINKLVYERHIATHNFNL